MAEGPQVLEQLKRMRFDLLWKDYVKFALISGASIGLLLLYLKRKLKFITLSAGFLVILLVDLIILDTGYINPRANNSLTEGFRSNPKLDQLQRESEAGVFRVFPVGQFDQQNVLMYHHIQSVLGYSPAKLKIYQEMLDSCVIGRQNQNVIDMLNEVFRRRPTSP